MLLNLIDVNPNNLYKTPPRFTEASLVKNWKNRASDASTYAAIMNKIQSRDYTVKRAEALKADRTRQSHRQMLEDNLPPDHGRRFTAQMEDDLEQVAENKKDWKELIRDFWDDSSHSLKSRKRSASSPKS